MARSHRLQTNARDQHHDHGPRDRPHRSGRLRNQHRVDDVPEVREEMHPALVDQDLHRIWRRTRHAVRIAIQHLRLSAAHYDQHALRRAAGPRARRQPSRRSSWARRSARSLLRSLRQSTYTASNPAAAHGRDDLAGHALEGMLTRAEGLACTHITGGRAQPRCSVAVAPCATSPEIRAWSADPPFTRAEHARMEVDRKAIQQLLLYHGAAADPLRLLVPRNCRAAGERQAQRRAQSGRASYDRRHA